jgi:hypothetical protein
LHLGNLIQGSWRLNSRYWTFGKKFNDTFGFCPLENATLGWGSQQPTSDQLASCVALNFSLPTINSTTIEAYLTNVKCKKKTFFACEVKSIILCLSILKKKNLNFIQGPDSPAFAPSPSYPSIPCDKNVCSERQNFHWSLTLNFIIFSRHSLGKWKTRKLTTC